MNRKAVPVFLALGLILIVVVAFLGKGIIERYIPTSEKADIEKLLGVKGDQVALFLNEELQEEKGIFVEGQTYLSIEWVNRMLNERFYWDINEKLLVYALPDSIVYGDQSTKGSSGKPILWVDGDKVYLSAGLILNYTDIRIAAYDSEENKRIYINNTWNDLHKAVLKGKSNIRVKGGIKSPIITEAGKGSYVTILEPMERWSKVRTEDGFIGYVENRRLGDRIDEPVKSSFEEPVYKSMAMDEPVSLAWHQVTTLKGNESLDSVIRNAKGIDVISPTWYELMDNEGNFRSLADAEYVKKSHSKGLKVWALIHNFSEDVNTEILLSKTSTRQKLIQSLMAEAKKYGFDGFNLDFEGIKEEAGVHYIQFIRELSISCRKEGLVLSVDNYVPAPGNEFYNRKEQGMVADYVIIMGYDEHYSGGDAGSVASIGYVEDGVKDTLLEVPKEKVILALPLYTRVWTEGEDGKITSASIGIANAKQWIDENQVEMKWLEESGQYYGEVNTSEGLKMLWMEEERSIERKMKLIEDYDLAGAAFWKLGLEPAQLWDVIEIDKK